MVVAISQKSLVSIIPNAKYGSENDAYLSHGRSIVGPLRGMRAEKKYMLHYDLRKLKTVAQPSTQIIYGRQNVDLDYTFRGGGNGDDYRTGKQYWTFRGAKKLVPNFDYVSLYGVSLMPWHDYLLCESKISLGARLPIVYKIYSSSSPEGEVWLSGSHNDLFYAERGQANVVCYQNPYDLEHEKVTIAYQIVQPAEIQEELVRQHSKLFYRELNKFMPINLATSLAELDETVKLLTSLTSSTLTRVPALDAVKVALRNVELAAKAGHAGRVVGTLNVLASAWLAWSYGLKPLFDDVRALLASYDFDESVGADGQKYCVLSINTPNPLTYAKSTSDKKRGRKVKKVKRPNRPLVTSVITNRDYGYPLGSTNGVNSVNHNINGKVTLDIGANSTGTQVYRGTSTTRIYYKGVYILRQMGDWDQARLGLLAAYDSVIWERLPLSFIVDWWFKVGEYLSNRGIARGVEVVLSRHMVMTETTFTSSTGTSAKHRSYFRQEWVEGDEYLSQLPLCIFGSPVGGVYADRIPTAFVQEGTGLGRGLTEGDDATRLYNAFALMLTAAESLVDSATTTRQAIDNLSGAFNKQQSKAVKKLLHRIGLL